MRPDPSQFSGPQAQRSRVRTAAPDVEIAPSKGIMGWWYAISAPQITSSLPSLAERELVRRGRLASTLILAILISGLVALPIDITNPSKVALYADIIGLMGCLVALGFNRIGAVTATGVLMVTLLGGGFAGIILTSGGLSVANLLFLPLLVLAELIAVSLLAPWTVFLIAVLNSAFAVFIVLEWPASAIVKALLNSPGALTLVIADLIVLYVIVALVAFLWVRSATRAMVARDHAEEIADLEHSAAEQRRNLETGMRQIYDVLVRVANGDYTARAPVNQDSMLWQLSAALNNMIARQQKVGDTAYQLQRASAEIGRLVMAVREARAGRAPLWPAETNTIIDPLIRELAGVHTAQQPAFAAPEAPWQSGGLPGAGVAGMLPGGPLPGNAPPGGPIPGNAPPGGVIPGGVSSRPVSQFELDYPPLPADLGLPPTGGAPDQSDWERRNR